ncbi:MAG: hypothetical protein CJBNEKGG_04487 [Prosthecobacter sp.]|nr:hypothetical protein [Prosthecobacter sp.]
MQRTREGRLWFAGSPESLAYDEDGNLTSDGRWTYAWDAENRLKSMETQSAAISAGVPAQRLEFAYDAQGRRVRKVVRSLSASGWVVTSDLRYLYDGWNLIAELEKSARLPAPAPPRLLRAYAWGRDLSGTEQGAGGVGGLVLAEQRRSMTTTGGGQPTSSTLAPTYDGNGNISAYVDLTSGRVMARLDYDAFGKPVWSEVGDTMGARSRIPFGFSTKYEDPETGILYYGFRYYSPETGRWLSRDPIGELGHEMTKRIACGTGAACAPCLSCNLGGDDLLVSSDDRDVLFRRLGFNSSDFEEVGATEPMQSNPTLGGPNLYGFVLNDPINQIDLLGEKPPTADAFWAAYPNYNSTSTDQAWAAAGGWLNDEHVKGDTAYYNSCALRVSIGLNGSGAAIGAGAPGANKCNGKYYIISARQMNAHLNRQWGAPDYRMPPKTLADIRSYLCPGMIAVASFDGHIGVITESYNDPHTPYIGTGDVWLLYPKN